MTTVCSIETTYHRVSRTRPVLLPNGPRGSTRRVSLVAEIRLPWGVCPSRLRAGALGRGRSSSWRAARSSSACPSPTWLLRERRSSEWPGHSGHRFYTEDGSGFRELFAGCFTERYLESRFPGQRDGDRSVSSWAVEMIITFWNNNQQNIEDNFLEVKLL